jgi:hypothetical protein
MNFLNHKQSLYVMYVFLIICFFSGMAYHYGYSKAYQSRSRPIYVKYTNSVNKSLSISLHQAGIIATPSQVEELGKILKPGGNRVR